MLQALAVGEPADGLLALTGLARAGSSHPMTQTGLVHPANRPPRPDRIQQPTGRSDGAAGKSQGRHDHNRRSNSRFGRRDLQKHPIFATASSSTVAAPCPYSKGISLIAVCGGFEDSAGRTLERLKKMAADEESRAFVIRELLGIFQAGIPIRAAVCTSAACASTQAPALRWQVEVAADTGVLGQRFVELLLQRRPNDHRAAGAGSALIDHSMARRCH